MKLLSLSGGGSNGAWQAGVIAQNWYENNYRPDVVAGTSVGALNAVLVSTGQIDIMTQVWNNLSDDMIRKKRSNFRLITNHLFHKIGIRNSLMAKFSNEPLRGLLRGVVIGMVTNIPCYISNVVVQDGNPDRYISTKIPAGTQFNDENIDIYLDLIIGSTAIPVIFEPVDLGDTILFDGGLHYSTPIYDAIRHEDINHMLAICCNPIKSIAVIPKDIIEVAVWTLNTLLAYQFYEQWKEFRRWNQVARQTDVIVDGNKIKYINDKVYFPETDLGNPLDFSRSKARKLYAMGYNTQDYETST